MSRVVELVCYICIQCWPRIRHHQCHELLIGRLYTCGRYAAQNRDAILEAFRFDKLQAVELPLRFNVAPTTPVPILLVEDGGSNLPSARWGLIPSWRKKPTPKSLPSNARSEEAAKKPT